MLLFSTEGLRRWSRSSGPPTGMEVLGVTAGAVDISGVVVDVAVSTVAPNDVMGVASSVVAVCRRKCMNKITTKRFDTSSVFQSRFRDLILRGTASGPDPAPRLSSRARSIFKVWCGRLPHRRDKFPLAGSTRRRLLACFISGPE